MGHVDLDSVAQHDLATVKNPTTLFGALLLMLTVALCSEMQEPAVCFAPGTPEETMRSFNKSGLSKFYVGFRWSTTAVDGSGLHQGDPTTLTWSIMPDGMIITGYAGEATSPSDLRAFLNGIYGNESAWISVIQQVFDRWSALTGITYVYDNDDGAAFPNSPGLLGVRGDIRIGGHPIDGTFRVLAYNFFPNGGDMVIDTSDGFYGDTSSNSLRLRNVISHEHGHGLGFGHVCPIDHTKLMEPIFTSAFDGPQHDDILGGQRLYGDPLEPNDTSETSIYLDGTVTASIDGAIDSDVYRFTGNSVTLTLRQIGHVYAVAPQNADGSCSAGTTVDSANANNLRFEVLDSDGSTVLARVGSAITNLQLAGDVHFVRVLGTNDNVQLYELSIDAGTIHGSARLTAETCPNGAIDPGETVTIGVLPQNQSFTFTATGLCGDPINPAFNGMTFAFVLGNLTSVTTTYIGGSVTIPDRSTIEQTISVPDSGMVLDVNVRLRINHTYDADLDISLIGPDGTSIDLSSDNGGNGDNYGTGECSGATVFDDQAAATVVGQPAPFLGTFRPEQALSAFDGRGANGDWILRVTDDAGPDLGMLVCWELQITRSFAVCCTNQGEPPPVLIPPTDLRGARTPDAISLAWSDMATGEDRWEIQRAQAKHPTFLTVGFAAANSTGFVDTTTTTIGHRTRWTYIYRVRCCAVGDCSDWSNTTTVKR